MRFLSEGGPAGGGAVSPLLRFASTAPLRLRPIDGPVADAGVVGTDIRSPAPGVKRFTRAAGGASAEDGSSGVIGLVLLAWASGMDILGGAPAIAHKRASFKH
ncbi:hypothetical protein ACG74X_20405 [Marivita sp. S0852]|uniref:hypothetical protein n=1 Tax=Marivita sp. S0852 TaxID=3373893 RepID=UPI003982AE94